MKFNKNICSESQANYFIKIDSYEVKSKII